VLYLLLVLLSSRLMDKLGEPFKLSLVMIGHYIIVSVTSLYTLICFVLGLQQVGNLPLIIYISLK
jgi:hypothetical protein